MTNIKISNLHPAGSELFSDFESYIDELGDGELEVINGGATPSFIVSISARIAARSSLGCWRFVISQTQAPTINTPTPSIVFSGAGGLSKALSNPFNSF